MKIYRLANLFGGWEGAVAYRLMRERGKRWLGQQTKAAAVGGAMVVTVVGSLQQDRCRVAVEG